MPRYELSEGTSDKFWAIELKGSSHTVTFGRIGTEGTSKTKSFANAAAAKQEYEKLIAEKTNKGYRLVGGAKAGKTSPAPKRAPRDSSGSGPVDAVAKLMKLVPPPKKPLPATGDWGEVASMMGTPLPADYRQIVERYGVTGLFADFLNILNPFTRNTFLNLAITGQDGFREGMPVSKEDTAAMRKLGVTWSAEGVMVVGWTFDRDSVFWIRKGSPDEWTVGVRGNKTRNRISVYPFGLAEFLCRWLHNELDVPALPKDEIFGGKVPAIYKDNARRRADERAWAAEGATGLNREKRTTRKQEQPAGDISAKGSGNALAKLMKLVPPPKKPRDARGDWKKVEIALGTSLPADYRQLVERYGSSGVFADFLSIKTPFESGDGNLQQGSRAALEAWIPVDEDDAEVMQKLGFEWSAKGILIVGQTSNGDYVFWIRKGPPDKWKIGVRGNEGVEDACVLPFGLVEFLYRWLSNRLDVPAFPRDDVFDGKVPAIYQEYPKLR